MKAKVALITGAAKRVGACIARKLHAEGMQVIIHYRHSQEAAEQLIAELNAIRKNSAACLAADLQQTSKVEQMAEQAVAIWGSVDVLVNNASAFYPTELGTATETQWDELFASNVKAAFFLTQALLPALKETNGVVVNMADVHAERPIKDFPIYCMAKAALVAMTKSLAKDLAPDVRVNAVAPGMILWPDDEKLEEKTEKYLLNRIALKRFGEPRNIAETILFLIQQDYITGQIIAIDGGRSLTI